MIRSLGFLFYFLNFFDLFDLLWQWNWSIIGIKNLWIIKRSIKRWNLIIRLWRYLTTWILVILTVGFRIWFILIWWFLCTHSFNFIRSTFYRLLISFLLNINIITYNIRSIREFKLNSASFNWLLNFLSFIKRRRFLFFFCIYRRIWSILGFRHFLIIFLLLTLIVFFFFWWWTFLLGKSASLSLSR